MAYVISVVNQKGGVGKTTTVVHLSSALSRLGYPVLVVDLDPQANVSTTLGLIDPYEVKTTVATLMLDKVVAPPAPLVITQKFSDSTGLSGKITIR